YYSSSPRPPTTAIYTLSLHDALPICRQRAPGGRLARAAQRLAAAAARSRRRAGALDQGRIHRCARQAVERAGPAGPGSAAGISRSEEHTSELQSLRHLVCRLLLEKKK